MKRDPNKPIAALLLAWYGVAKRDLPWRRTSDPYRIWLSEIMLQQTTVSVVEGRFAPFLAKFPDLRTLAAASEEKVVAAWSGLGYYSRARAFHRAARIVAAEHGGKVPSDAVAFRALPGVGPYTAGAVLSIAFGCREPLVDGNVARVLCRLFALHGDPVSGTLKKRLWTLAADLLPARDPGDFNQAMMELGALICTPAAPACPACPLRKVCHAFAQGVVELIPTRKKSAATSRVRLAGALFESGRGILLARRSPEETPLAGMWLFPGGQVKRWADAPRLLTRIAGRALGASVDVSRAPVVKVSHSITRYRIDFRLFEARFENGPPSLRGLPRFAWVRRRGVAELPVSSLVTKSLGKLDQVRR